MKNPPEFLAQANLETFDATVLDWNLHQENALFVHLMINAPRGAVFYDVGSFKGNTCIPVARALKRLCRADVVVVAFEPLLEHTRAIEQIAAAEQLTLVVHRAVVGEHHQGFAQKLEASVGGSSQMYTMGGDIPVVSLDGLQLAAPWLIKIDVEGMEDAVLRGGRTTVASAKYVYAEIWSDAHFQRRSGSKKAHVRAILEAMPASLLPQQRVEKNVLFRKTGCKRYELEDALGLTSLLTGCALRPKPPPPPGKKVAKLPRTPPPKRRVLPVGKRGFRARAPLPKTK